MLQVDCTGTQILPLASSEIIFLNLWWAEKCCLSLSVKSLSYVLSGNVTDIVKFKTIVKD